MNKLFRFIYLNTYSFLLLFGGVILIGIPLYKINVFLYFISLALGLFLIYQSINLFSTWNYKKREYKILMNINSKEFNPESFKVFIQAPCGRLLTKVVLKDLGKSKEYKNLLKLKKPLVQNCKENFKPVKTKITFFE